MSEMILILLPLAQTVAEPPKSTVEQATWWLGGILVVALVLFVIAGIVIYVIRNRALRSESTSADIPLTLAEVRRMHESGEIDDDEMQKLKEIVTSQARRGLTSSTENEGDLSMAAQCARPQDINLRVKGFVISSQEK